MKTKYTIYCVLIALAALSTPISADMLGDVNADGTITTADSLLALRMAVGSVAQDPERADVNADCRVNSLDALMIRTIAAQQTQVCVNSPEVVSGAFEVTIEIHNVDDLDSGQFDLSFNSSVVTVKDVEAGRIDGTEIPIMWRFRNIDAIKVLFNLPGLRGVSGSGYVAKISFEIKGSGGDNSHLNISNGELVNNRADTIPVIWNDCEVTIGEHPPLNRVHNLNTGEDFSFIQAAIDDQDTLDWHIIEVDDGLYRESLNVTKSLTIRSENGSANCVIQGAGGDYVVEMTADHVSISRFTVAGMRTSGMVCSMAGIYLNASCCNVSENNCSNNRIGICLCNFSNNNISNNDCSNNEQAGICLDGSGNNRLSGNAMFENGIVIRGDSLSDYTQEIDETNTVNGKPVYYWKDVESGRIPDGAGQVILVNCEGVLVENQKLNGASIGIEVAFSSNVTVRNNKCSDNRDSGIHLSLSQNNVISSNHCLNNRDGICLCNSSNNNISSNNCLNNDDDGICLSESSKNSLSKNICSNEEGAGIHLYESRNNVVSSNDCSNNRDDGIHLGVSSNNSITSNDCSNSRDYGVRLDNSSGNSISHNNCSNDMRAGIFLGCSGSNSISHNNCSNNRWDGIHFYESSDNIIYLNNFINNRDDTDSCSSTNIWNSTLEVNYTYEGRNYTNYLGNYWDEYEGNDSDNDGIGDTPHTVGPEKDDCPLVMPSENYFAPEPAEDRIQVSVDAPEMASDTFDATIEIRNVEDLDSGQFDLTYDSSVVNVTGVNVGHIDGTTVPIALWHFVDADTIRVIFELYVADGVGASGSGYVAGIDFEVTGSQGDVSVLGISDGEFVDTKGDEIPAIWLDDAVTIAVPVTVNAPEHVSGAFEVTIDIENVTDLDSGQFELWFDSSVVNVTGVSAGNISGTAVPMDLWVFGFDESILVLFTLPGLVGVSGSGQIATISFETTGLEGYSVLNILDGLLVDKRANTIPVIWTDDMVISGENSLVDRVHNLNTGEDFFFIGDAIDDPDTLDGHTIMVGNGVHRENVRVTKSLTILSENGFANCIIKAARESEPAIEITADHVNMSGFTVMKRGIRLAADYCNVSDNLCSNNQIGIYLNGSNNIVSGNDCSNNERFGIYLDGSSNNRISGNNCTSNSQGISLDDSNNNSISQNNCSSNIRYEGISLEYSNNNSIIGNTFVNDGLHLYHSTQNEVRDNTVNNKPLVYLENESDQEVEGAGQVILVNCDNITVGHSNISNTSVGIHLVRTTNCKILKNNISSNYMHGICLDDSSNNTIRDNNLSSNNRHGIYLHRSSDNNTIRENLIESNNADGIHLAISGHNELINNTVNRNHGYGIYLWHWDSTSMLRGNRMSGNRYNFAIIDSFDDDVDTTNLVNGKPIYYIKNASDIIIDSTTNAGTVYCVNCENVTVKDLLLANNGAGVCFYDTNNSRVENVTSIDCREGISLHNSHSNTLTNNCASNGLKGVCMRWSDNNVLTNNAVLNNSRSIDLYRSNNSQIYLNNFVYNSLNIRSLKSPNAWRSLSKMEYTYSGKTFTNYLGNYWGDYAGSDSDNDGIGESPHDIDSDRDNYPLVMPIENYSVKTENIQEQQEV